MKALSTLLLLLALGACASTPPSPPSPDRPAVAKALSDRAAAHASKMVGRPYRYGGASPAGFDCSGLVHYSYRQAGVKLPRATEAQLAAARRIKLAQLRPGDLLFFNQEGKRFGHVGLYLGNGRFVHAPSSGKTVRTDRLDSPYWKKHLTEARRPA